MNPSLYMVRLGEHDYASQSEKARQDIRVARAVPHAQYDKSLMINDIAILHLSRDVQFNGKFNFASHFLKEKTFSSFEIIFFFIVFLTERIKPVCLPIDETMRYKSFLRTNPFVAGTSLAYFTFVKEFF